MSKQCSDPQMEFLLLKEIAISKAEGRPSNFSPQIEKHLHECEKCRRMLPEWIDKINNWDKPMEKPHQ